MAETRLQALERRWRASGHVDDELAVLQERVRCGEPRRGLPGEPLRSKIEALAELHAAGRRAELLARVAAERDAAGPVWFRYWDGLHSGLDPDSPLYRKSIEGRDYGIAEVLATLSTRHGQSLAKSILRDLAPRYWDIPLAEARIVRVLGGGLDPREDPDARLLLVDLLERWDIDPKSGNQFMSALSLAGLDVCLPRLERRLASNSNDQRDTLELLTSHDEAAPSTALRDAIATWDDPSWLTYAIVLRGDREAAPALRAALRRLAPGGPAAQTIELGLAALAAGALSDATLETLRERMYVRLQLDPPAFAPDQEFADPEPTTTSLREQLLMHVVLHIGWGRACDRSEHLTRWHGLDPRLTPELTLVILADAARGDPDKELRDAARHAIWNLGLLEID